MKRIQCKCRTEQACKKQLVKWLKDKSMTDVGFDRVGDGFVVFGTKRIAAGAA